MRQAKCLPYNQEDQSSGALSPSKHHVGMVACLEFQFQQRDIADPQSKKKGGYRKLDMVASSGFNWETLPQQSSGRSIEEGLQYQSRASSCLCTCPHL